MEKPSGSRNPRRTQRIDEAIMGVDLSRGHTGGYAKLGRRCLKGGPVQQCRKMRYRGWSIARAKTSAPGGTGI